jgi:hypothetical protein
MQFAINISIKRNRETQYLKVKYRRNGIDDNRGSYGTFIGTGVETTVKQFNGKVKS